MVDLDTTMNFTGNAIIILILQILRRRNGHGLWNLWFGTNFWPQFCIGVFFCFCNWYIILIWRVETPSFKMLKSILLVQRERKALFLSSLPLTASSEAICQIHLRWWTLSPQTCCLGRCAGASCLQLCRAWPAGGVETSPAFPSSLGTGHGAGIDMGWSLHFGAWLMRLFWGPRAARLEEMNVRPVSSVLGWGSVCSGSPSLEWPSPGALAPGVCWHLGDHGRLIYPLCCCSLGWLQRLW